MTERKQPKLVNLNTCSKPEYLRYMLTVEGRSLQEAQQMWAYGRGGESDLIVDGVFDATPSTELGATQEA